MARVRVLVAGLPRMLRDIVHAVVRAQPDLDLVVDAGTDRADVVPADVLPRAVGAAGAHVAIVGLESDALTATYDVVLYAHPRLRILALTAAGRSAVAYELRPLHTPLGDASADALLAAIRAVVADGAGARTLTR